MLYSESNQTEKLIYHSGLWNYIFGGCEEICIDNILMLQLVTVFNHDFEEFFLHYKVEATSESEQFFFVCEGCCSFLIMDCVTHAVAAATSFYSFLQSDNTFLVFTN